MNKKFFIAAMAAVVSFGMISCSQDDDIANVASNNNKIENSAPGRIEFTGLVANSPATRGTAITAAADVANFQVFGFLADGTQYVGSALNSGIMIDKNGANWDYRTASDVAYWPKAVVNFQAISPASDASFSIEETDLESNNQRLTAIVNVPTDQSAQKDIMFAKTSEDGNDHTADSNPAVGLTFDHAMSQVVFKGKVASDKISVTVADIKIMNAYQEGKVGYFGASQALSSDLTGHYANQDYSAGLVADPTLNAANVSTAKDLSAADGALFMLPQTVTKWATVAGTPVTVAAAEGTASANGQGILAIKCTITSAGQTLVNDEYVYIPFEISWLQGKKYIYTLVFGKGTGAFDEDGEPLDSMLPITYTVSAVNAWTDVTPDDIEF